MHLELCQQISLSYGHLGLSYVHSEYVVCFKSNHKVTRLLNLILGTTGLDSRLF